MYVKEKMMLAVVLTKENPDIPSDEIVKDVGKIFRYGHKMKTMVDGIAKGNTIPNYEKQREALINKIEPIVAKYGATVLQHRYYDDVLGTALRLVLKSGRSNHLGNDSWGVL